MSLLSARWAYTLAATAVTWGAYFAWEKQKEGIVREQRLPLIEKALAVEVHDSSDAFLCVGAGPFPAGERLPSTRWEKLPNGLSECRVSFNRDRSECGQCDTLTKMGLLTHDEEPVTDASGMTANARVYRLTSTGRDLYFGDMRARAPGEERGCKVGEVKYVSSQDEQPAAPGNPGFCFGKELRLLPITEFQMPGKIGNQMVIGVRYQVEVIDPAPQLFDERLKPILHELPKRGAKALYDPGITTAYFSPDKQSVEQLDPGTRYGDWIGKK